MFPSKYPALYILHMLGVLIVIALVLFVTNNPLAMLGLILMPQVPLVPGPDMGAPERAPAIGFLAGMGEDEQFDE